MKISTLVLLVGSALTSNLALANTQYIDCQNDQTSHNEHVMISLTSETAGSLYMTSKIEQVTGNSTASSALQLKRLTMTNKDQATFVTGNDSVSMTLQIPTAVLLKSSNSFGATISTNIVDVSMSSTQTLNCIAKMDSN